jgi:hypothetical protein
MSPDREAALELVLDEFARAWRNPIPPRLDDFLPSDSTPENRAAVLCELVATDLEQRLARGGPARLEEYLRRFADMAEDLDAVAELAAWESTLRSRREGSVAVQECLDRFPAQAGQLWHRLDTGTPTGALPTWVYQAARIVGRLLPRRLGSYELLEQLGKGGMGEVYRARRVQLNKVFALKVISAVWAEVPEQRSYHL